MDLCLFSGQTFRWRKTDAGVYEGVDGPNWYRIDTTRGALTSNNPDGAIGLFRLKAYMHGVHQEIIRRGPELEPFIKALPGLRQLRPSDPVEVFFCFMCTANNHLARITPMCVKLAEYGPLIKGTSFHRFPDVATIASIDENELRAKGFGYRGATIPHAAREVLVRGGDEWIASLKELPYKEAHRELVSIKGLGNKLADCIALYGLHKDEAVPIDTHFWQAATRLYFLEHQGKAVTERRYMEIGDFFRERFGPYAGWAHLYLYFENLLNWRKRA